MTSKWRNKYYTENFIAFPWKMLSLGTVTSARLLCSPREISSEIGHSNVIVEWPPPPNPHPIWTRKKEDEMYTHPVIGLFVGAHVAIREMCTFNLGFVA